MSLTAYAKKAISLIFILSYLVFLLVAPQFCAGTPFRFHRRQVDYSINAEPICQYPRRSCASCLSMSFSSRCLTALARLRESQGDETAVVYEQHSRDGWVPCPVAKCSGSSNHFLPLAGGNSGRQWLAFLLHGA